jgi:hypothetical protein
MLNLPTESVVVIDNAPYHNVNINKIPTSNSAKKEMQQWSQKQNIPFADDMLKPALHRLIKQCKPQQVQCSVQESLGIRAIGLLIFAYTSSFLSQTDRCSRRLFSGN